MTEISETKKMTKNYPTIEVRNHNQSVDGQLAASLERQKLLSYEFIIRYQTQMLNVPSFTHKYENEIQKDKKCRIVFKNNAMKNQEEYLSGDYNFYSEN